MTSDMVSLSKKKISIVSKDTTVSQSTWTSGEEDDSTLTNIQANKSLNPSMDTPTVVYMDSGNNGDYKYRSTENHGLNSNSSHHSLRSAVSSLAANSEHTAGGQVHDSISSNRPNEFVTPQHGRQKRSWRPKTAIASSSASVSSLPPAFPAMVTESSSSGTDLSRIPPRPKGRPPLQRPPKPSSLPARVSSPRDRIEMPPEVFCDDDSVASSPWNTSGHRLESVETPTRNHGEPSWKRSISSAPCHASGESKVRACYGDLPHPPMLDEEELPSMSFSNHDYTEYRSYSSFSTESPRRWQRPLNIDSANLPSAFKASLTAPKVLTSSPALHRQGRRLDVSKLELVKGAPKEKIKVGKLNYRWPPVEISSSSEKHAPERLLFQSLGAASIKERCTAFIKHMQDLSTTRSSTMTPIDIILSMIQDDSLAKGAEHRRQSDIGPEDEALEQARVMEKVDRILEDHLLVSAIWAASPGMGEDEEWTCQGFMADLSESERTKVIEKVKEVMQDRGVLAGVWAHSSPPCCVPGADGKASSLPGPLSKESRWQTSVKIRWGGQIYHDDNGVPLSLKGSAGDARCDKLPPVPPLLNDRFGSAAHREDRPPMVARRFPSLVGAPEHCPQVAKKVNRPTVWVGRWCVSDNIVGDDDVDDDIWRVRRVWDDPTIDEKEVDHRVQGEDLMTTVKELMGVPIDINGEEWCITKVYDVDGVVQVASRTMKVDEPGMTNCFCEVAKTQGVSVSQISSTGHSKTQARARPSATHPGCEEQITALSSGKVPTGVNTQRKSSNAAQSTTKRREAGEQNAILLRESPEKLKSGHQPEESPRMERRRNAGGGGPETLFDLLSPPPIYVFYDK